MSLFDSVQADDHSEGEDGNFSVLRTSAAASVYSEREKTERKDKDTKRGKKRRRASSTECDSSQSTSGHAGARKKTGNDAEKQTERKKSRNAGCTQRETEERKQTVHLQNL